MLAEAEDGDWTAELHPDEEPAIERAVERRQAEFRAGRACAHRALATLGFPAAGIPRDATRAPVWPAGVVGAITHCDGYCGAAVARVDDYSGLGIDAEVVDRVTDDILTRITTPREREVLTDLPPDLARFGAAALFSVKESVHKALYPRTGVALAFTDVELALGPDERVTILDLSDRAAEAFGSVPVELRVRYCEPLVVSVVAQGPGETGRERPVSRPGS